VRVREVERERRQSGWMEENNWMIHSRLQGEVFIQNSYIVEDTRLKNKQRGTKKQTDHRKCEQGWNKKELGQV
jgi:hypothetical protein